MTSSEANVMDFINKGKKVPVNVNYTNVICIRFPIQICSIMYNDGIRW